MIEVKHYGSGERELLSLMNGYMDLIDRLGKEKA